MSDILDLDQCPISNVVSQSDIRSKLVLAAMTACEAAYLSVIAPAVAPATAA